MAVVDGRISRRNVSFEVAEYIRDQIFVGGLRFGAKVPQEDIAAQLGVSRLPVREALIALESDGMVVSEPHRGTFVADILPKDLLDHYRICGVIHGVAATRAAVVITEAELLDLEDVNARMAGEHSQADEAYSLHWTFHQTINRIGGSRRLRAVLRQLSHQLPQSLFTSVSPEQIDAAAAHRSILQAFRERQPEQAGQVCREHLEREGRFVVENLQTRGLWADRSPTVAEPSAEPIMTLSR
jgi:DNA-binding GntR family transcriptional regulator